MRKIVCSIILSSSLLLANSEYKDEKFQILAKDVVNSSENIITATGDVVIYSPTYYLSANKAIFKQDSEEIELFGNVLIIKDNNIQSQSDYAKVDLKNDNANQTPVFLMQKDNGIWVNSKESDKQKELIKLDGSIISSCDCIDPAWSIRTSSSDYDTENMWINAYNPRLYFKDIPVFYLPYWGFPTDTTRRTGLLLPYIGYSKSEGLFYSQPIFLALAPNYDLELIPQMRNLRGAGIYSNFRYADSPDSMLEIKTGYFKEKSKYRKKEELENSEHYGIDLKYKRENILSKNKKEHSDGLYTKLTYLNDVEYITLDDDDLSTDKKVESKLNYFYNTPSYYGGIYGKYYIDVSKKSNKNTLQELPQIQLHSYSKELFLEGLLYSLDARYTNYYRKEGLNADIYELNLPLSYSKNILDDYMFVGIDNSSTLSKYNYSKSKFKYDDATLLQNKTSFFIGSDLIRPYTDYIHTMNLKASYDIPKNLKKDGDIRGITLKEHHNRAKYKELEDFPIAQDHKQIKLSLNQSFYDKETTKQIVNHKISQSIMYDSFDEFKTQDLENYLKFNHDYGSFSSRVIYNMQDRTIVESSNSLSLNYNDFNLSANYYKSKSTDNEFNYRDDVESYGYKGSYKVAKDYSISYFENYDIKDKVRNRQGIGLNIDDSCWNLDLRVEKEIKPGSRYNQVRKEYDSHKQTIVYAQLILKPLGGVKKRYVAKDNKNEFN